MTYTKITSIPNNTQFFFCGIEAAERTEEFPIGYLWGWDVNILAKDEIVTLGRVYFHGDHHDSMGVLIHHLAKVFKNLSERIDVSMLEYILAELYWFSDRDFKWELLVELTSPYNLPDAHDDEPKEELETSPF